MDGYVVILILPSTDTFTTHVYINSARRPSIALCEQIVTAKRGDIYYIRGTETTGSEQGGNRPAVIVSNNTGNHHAPVVEVVYLTTKRKTTIPTHVYINSARRPSIALCEQIVTVCKSRLKEHIGSVTVAEMRKIDRALQTSLGIQKTGGENMQVTIKTPFGEMSFNMTQDKANDLMSLAAIPPALLPSRFLPRYSQVSLSVGLLCFLWSPVQGLCLRKS
jgi:mRNA-degrading endonuclease toxin of MazEF toxin-antitoxin module